MTKQDLTKQVLFILNTEPESRNSDITLMICLWKRYYPESVIYSEKRQRFYVALDSLFNLPREDNIKRIRAKIQNVDRLYLPTNPDIFIERAKLSKEWKEFLGYQSWWNDVNWNKSVAEYLEKRKTPALF